MSYNQVVKKVTVDIVGGLGNQLFCYSAGYYLKKKNNMELELRINNGMNSTYRDLSQIATLNLPGKFSRAKVLPIGRSKNYSRLLRFSIRKINAVVQRNLVVSRSLGFDPQLEVISSDVHLQGYFQTWKYAESARELILNSLEESVPQGGIARKWAEALKVENSLVLHIRLGDYKKQENSYFGILSPSYYAKLIDRIDVTKYRIFVFTDDFDHAQKEYSSSLPQNSIWVDADRELTSIETLYVMSHGSAFIIANSTFSWWAAYLREKKDFVIAPSKWFESHEDPVDLMPDDWIQEESNWLS